MRRRTVLTSMMLLGAALRARLAAAATTFNRDGFSATSLGAAMQALFGERQPQPSDAITMDMEPKIENGAVVPIQVRANLDAVETIDFFAELNPNPLLARFHLSPRCRPFIATRIKVGAPSNVIVVMESRGQLLETRKFVEVVEGGCG